MHSSGPHAKGLAYCSNVSRFPAEAARTVLTMFLARRANARVCAVCTACASAALTFAMMTALQLPPMESCSRALQRSLLFPDRWPLADRIFAEPREEGASSLSLTYTSAPARALSSGRAASHLEEMGQLGVAVWDVHAAAPAARLLCECFDDAPQRRQRPVDLARLREPLPSRLRLLLALGACVCRVRV